MSNRKKRKYLGHIKLRFINSFIQPTSDSYMSKIIVEDNFESKLDITALGGQYGIMTFEKGDSVQCFPYNINGKNYFIPEANPIAVYFNLAQGQVEKIYHARIALLSNLESSTIGNNAKKQRMQKNAWEAARICYDYFGLASVFVTQLFYAVEAFNNFIIPEDFVYEKKHPQGGRWILDKEAIQRWMSFKDKMNEIVPKVFGKDFKITATHLHKRILDLNSLRDEIVHTKVYHDENPNWYRSLYTQLLNLDYYEVLLACYEYFNFYQPGLITECDCKKNVHVS